MELHKNSVLHMKKTSNTGVIVKYQTHLFKI